MERSIELIKSSVENNNLKHELELTKKDLEIEKLKNIKQK